MSPRVGRMDEVDATPATGDLRFLNLPDDPMAGGGTERRSAVPRDQIRALFGLETPGSAGPEWWQDQQARLLGFGKYAGTQGFSASLRAASPSPSENRSFLLRRVLGNRSGATVDGIVDLIDPITPFLDLAHRRRQGSPYGAEDLLIAAGILPGPGKIPGKYGRKALKAAQIAKRRADEAIHALPSKNAAFRSAKRANHIPITAQPEKVVKPNTPDADDYRLDQCNNRMYIFQKTDGKKLYIRSDKPVRYNENGRGDQGPHFNAGEYWERLDQHYYYRK